MRGGLTRIRRDATPEEWLAHVRMRLRVQTRRDGDCLVWTGPESVDGYGCLELPPEVRAHRTAYVVAHGSIPAGLHVLHTCDNKACVEPLHLYAGTHQDNMRDAKERHRYTAGDQHHAHVHRDRLRHPHDPGGMARGDDHWTRRNPEAVSRGPKLNAEKAAQIRERLREGALLRVVAAEFDISTATVSAVGTGRSWRNA